MLADLAGWLNVVTVIAPIVVFMVGAGMASPFALTGAVSVNPHAIGAASGLYGFTQMAYGALCTVIVEVWRPGSVFPVAAVLLVSALLGQAALSLAVRREVVYDVSGDFDSRDSSDDGGGRLRIHTSSPQRLSRSRL